MKTTSHAPAVYRIAYIAAIILLAFNGAGAIYGGCGLVAHPDGSTIGLDIKLLTYTPFTNYLVPGLVLILLNGIFDGLVLVATIRKVRAFHRYIIAQGTLLLLWLAIQILLIRTIDQMHFIMGLTGALMVASGLMIMTQQKDDAQ